MRNIFLLLLIYSVITPSIVSSFETAVAIKKGIQDYNYSMAVGVESFKELIKKSNVFVDNTLLIEEQVQATTDIYHLAPRKWGKTINLDMLQAFFELHVDDQGKVLPKNQSENYRLFTNGEIIQDNGTVEKLENPLLISTRILMMENYLCSYPVIRVNFGNVSGNNLTEIKNSISEAIRQAFHRHKYMIHVLQNTEEETLKNKADEFFKIYNDTAPNDDLMLKRIRLLSDVLSIHFKLKTIILFDDYDKPLLSTLHVPDFPRNEAKDVLKFMDALAGATFTLNVHLNHAIVTGTFELYQLVDFSKWEKYFAMDAALNSQSITQYYGFSRKDIHRLFDLYNIPANMSLQADEWYNGYVSENTGRHIYNPFSIACFLQNKKIENYWLNMDDFKLLSKTFKKHIHIRNKLLILLSKQLRVQIHRKRRLSEEEINNLKTGDHRNSYDNFIWYFFRIGYVTYQPFTAQIDRHKMNCIWVKIPNKEMMHEIANWMMKHYRQRYYVVDHLLQAAAVEMLTFIKDQFAEATPFRLAMQRLYKEARHSPILPANYSASSTEDPIHNIFTLVTIKMHTLCSFEYDVYYNRAMEVFTIIINQHTKQAFLIELKYTEKIAETVMSSIDKYIPIAFQNFTNVEQINAVAVSVSPAKAVDIVIAKKYRNEKS